MIITFVEDTKSRPKQSLWSTNQDWHTLKLHYTLPSYTTHAQTTSHTLKLHDTRSNYTTHVQITRHMFKLHYTRSKYKTHAQTTWHTPKLRDTASNYTIAHQTTRHTLKLQGTRSSYTIQHQTTRYSVKHPTVVKATVLMDKIKTNIPVAVSLVQGLFNKSKLSRFQGTRYIVKPSRSVKADASGR